MRRCRQLISIPRLRARMTKQVALERTCRKRRRPWTTQPDWGALSMGRRRMGISMRSEVSLLGEAFDVVVVSDFYGAYNVHQGLHRRRWTHLSRGIHHIRHLKEQHPQHRELAPWSQRVREVYDQARSYASPDPGLPATVHQTQRVKQQTHQQLSSICQPYLGNEALMRMPCQRKERFSPQLLTFVADPRMNASHNAAERILRPTAVSRKISGGTRSEQASETKSIMASLFGPLRLQGRNPYLALNSLLSKPLPAPV